MSTIEKVSLVAAIVVFLCLLGFGAGVQYGMTAGAESAPQLKPKLELTNWPVY